VPAKCSLSHGNSSHLPKCTIARWRLIYAKHFAFIARDRDPWSSVLVIDGFDAVLAYCKLPWLLIILCCAVISLPKNVIHTG
jgi:hypothetical protein